MVPLDVLPPAGSSLARQHLAALARPHRAVAILGTAKNVGKTTTLDHLLAVADRRMAITSVGRDGEPRDVLTDRPKPRISPPPGVLVATALTAARRSTARLALVRETPFRTALGPVAIYAVEAPGLVEVAGPVAVRDTAAIVGLLRDLGADQVLVDGAIDRRAAAAAPGVEATVLATGLAAGDSLEEVLDASWAHVRPFTVPSFGATEAERVPAQAGAVDAAGGFRPFPGATVLDAEDRFVAWLPAGTATVVLAGAVTGRLARALVARAAAAGGRAPQVLVADATRLMLDAAAWRDLDAAGVAVRVRHALRLLAVTANPTSPAWTPEREPAAEVFLAALRERLPEVPVLDLGPYGD